MLPPGVRLATFLVGASVIASSVGASAQPGRGTAWSSLASRDGASLASRSHGAPFTARDGPPRAARHGAARRPGVPCGSATATTSHGAISRSEDRRTATACRASYGRAATRVSTGFGSAAAAPSRGAAANT